MKNNIVLILCLALTMSAAIISCQKKSNPAAPAAPANTATISPTPSISPTSSVTPTVTLTPHVVLVDNFNDGDLINEFANQWYEYWPYDGEWAGPPTIVTGETGYGLRVTGYVTANNEITITDYSGYFGTTTWIQNSPGIDINPANYVNISLKLLENKPVISTGYFVVKVDLTSGGGSDAVVDVLPKPGTSWQDYKIALSSFTMNNGNMTDIKSALALFAVYVYYYTPTQDEIATAELYVDNVYFTDY
jgi:hypothetical protein